MRLDGKVGIVTGAASGIGQATALAFGREGAKLVISDINVDGVEKVAATLRGMGVGVLAIKADISKEEEVNQMVVKAINEFGRVDILINNAAYLYFEGKYFHDMEPAEWEPHINITLKGTLYCTRAVVPHMIKQKSGRIISITSMAGKFPMPGLSLYSASKAGIAGFSRCLAAELARYNILVNCVAPGGHKTPVRHFQTLPPGEAEKTFANLPLRRLGTAEDIANIVLFLASDEAGYITGQQYSVDGGVTML